jgi:hypothetical protein
MNAGERIAGAARGAAAGAKATAQHHQDEVSDEREGARTAEDASLSPRKEDPAGTASGSSANARPG